MWRSSGASWRTIRRVLGTSSPCGRSATGSWPERCRLAEALVKVHLVGWREAALVSILSGLGMLDHAGPAVRSCGRHVPWIAGAIAPLVRRSTDVSPYDPAVHRRVRRGSAAGVRPRVPYPAADLAAAQPGHGVRRPAQSRSLSADRVIQDPRAAQQ